MWTLWINLTPASTNRIARFIADWIAFGVEWNGSALIHVAALLTFVAIEHNFGREHNRMSLRLNDHRLRLCVHCLAAEVAGRGLFRLRINLCTLSTFWDVRSEGTNFIA